MFILAIDPGGGTGWVLHELGTKKYRRGCFLVTSSPYHAKLLDFLSETRPDVIVYEEFVYRVQYIGKGRKVASPTINLMAKEYIGIIRLYAQQSGCKLVVRQPGQGFDFWKDDKLKGLGLYLRGQKKTNGAPHINDAMRHLLGYIVHTLNRRDYLMGLRR